MIEIIYNKPYNRLTVKGHADGEDSGHNIPCGCASILAYTLNANVQHLVDVGAAHLDSMVMDVGYAEIACTPVRHKDLERIRTTYETVCVGFEVLAEAYKDVVSYEIRGE